MYPPDLDHAIPHLREVLAGPPRYVGYGIEVTPEQDIVDAVRQAPSPAIPIAGFAKASSDLLAECEDAVKAGDASTAIVSLVARLAYLCATLKLDIDGRPFSRIGRRLLDADTIGHLVETQNLFHVLRTAGRYEPGWLPAGTEGIPWTELLDHPDPGIRTLAAQVLARLDGPLVMARLPRLLLADINEGMLAHEILRVMGEQALVEAVSALDRDVASRLVKALRNTGQDEVARKVEARVSVVHPISASNTS